MRVMWYDSLRAVNSPNVPTDEYGISERFRVALESQVLGFPALIAVSQGLMTDGASIPGWARPVVGCPFDPSHVHAAVVHDALYAAQLTTRKEADGVFRELLAALPVAAWKRALMYSAVRVGGRGSRRRGTGWRGKTPEEIAYARTLVSVEPIPEVSQ